MLVHRLERNTLNEPSLSNNTMQKDVAFSAARSIVIRSDATGSGPAVAATVSARFYRRGQANHGTLVGRSGRIHSSLIGVITHVKGICAPWLR